MARRKYFGTFFYPDNLEEATIRLHITKKTKYEERWDEAEIVEFKGLKSWTIVEGGKEAEAVESIMDEIDENHEYLILDFGGHTEFYRNSHVTMFIR